MSDTRKPWEYSIPVVSKAPRPVSITTVKYDVWVITSVLYDDGTVWECERGEWTRLPPIPQGDA